MSDSRTLLQLQAGCVSAAGGGTEEDGRTGVWGGSGRGGGAAGGGGCIESDCHFIFNNTQLLCSLSDQQLRLIGTQWRARTHTHHVHVHTDNTCTCY